MFAGELSPTQNGQPMKPGPSTRFHSHTPAGERVGLFALVVVAVLADDDGARVRRVRLHGERLAEAHRVDLGPRLGRAGREHVPRRDRVRGVDARLRPRRDLVERMDADDLAAQVGRIRRRLAGVPALLRAVVHRRVAVVSGRVRRDVVADAEVEVAVGVEVQPGAADVAGAVVGRAAGEAGRVAGDLRLGHAQDHALGVGHDRRARLVEREAADLVVAHDDLVARGRPRRIARRVVDEDVALRRIAEVEAVLERHAEHAVLGVAVVGTRRDRGDGGLVAGRARSGRTSSGSPRTGSPGPARSRSRRPCRQARCRGRSGR